jgi:hypothetical protein
MPEIAPERSPKAASIAESKEKTPLPAPFLPAPPQPEKPPTARTQGAHYPVLGAHAYMYYVILLVCYTAYLLYCVFVLYCLFAE